MMRIRCIAFFLFLASLASYGKGDDSTMIRLANTINRFNRAFPQEKVYLHFDNTGYFVGETIWFKAYVTTTECDQLSSRSSVLYVELIDPSGNVAVTKKLKITNGTAHGDIRLNEIQLSGFYEVRAYTRYMLNWGREAIFSRVFPVFKRPKTDGDYTQKVLEQEVADKWLPNKTVGEQVAKQRHNVRFYPEGGSLVVGMESRVAFECFDNEGKPLETTGWLMQDGKRIREVKSGKDGRGLFPITCERGKNSRLALTFSNGKNSQFDLPQAIDEGVVMNVSQDNDSLKWKITISDSLKGTLIGQIFIHHGKMFHCNIIDDDFSQGAMSRKSMPSGVSQIVIADTAGNIYSDRLVFIYPRQNDIETININATDSTIWPAKRMTIEIKAKPNANISLAVCDAQTQTGGWMHNAATWLLLTSDLKGYVNKPEYYFESDDEAHRQASDLLMMVQGWRRHNVKMMMGKEIFVKEYPIEDRLYIDGQLKQKRRNATVDNVKIGMMLSNEQGDQIAGETVTTPKGYYAFAVPDCYRQWNLVIMTRKENKDIDYNVTINRHFSPEVTAKSWYQLNPTDSVKPSFAYNLSPQYEDLLPMELKNHWIKTVNVYGHHKWKSPRQFWERESRGAAYSIMKYDCQREADKIADNGEAMPTLEEWLKKENPDFTGAEILYGSSNYDGYNDVDAVEYEDDGSIRLSDNNSKDPFKERSFHSEGLTYQNRPIMWIVNNSFFGGTGFNSLHGLPDDIRDKMRIGSYVNFPHFPQRRTLGLRIRETRRLDAICRFARTDGQAVRHGICLYLHERQSEKARRSDGEDF